MDEGEKDELIQYFNTAIGEEDDIVNYLAGEDGDAFQNRFNMMNSSEQETLIREL